MRTQTQIRPRVSRVLGLAAALALTALAFPAVSGATFGGASGAVVFSSVSSRVDGDSGEVAREGGLYAIRPGHPLNQLTANIADREPDFAPNGREIVFVRDGDLYAMRADGSGQRRLTSGPAVDAAPAFAPNSRYILFERAAAPGGQRDLYVVGADGEGLRPLTSSGDDEHDAAFSPDGREIVFVRTTPLTGGGDDDDLFSIRPGGSGLVSLTHDDLDEFDPHYFAGGIVFSRGERGDGPSAYADVFTMRRNGTRVLELHSGPGSEYVEDVSPAGRTLLYRTDQGLWARPIRGGAGRRLLSFTDALGANALFSPDGSRVAAYVGTSGADTLSSIGTSGAEDRPTVLAGTFHSPPGTDPLPGRVEATIGADFTWQPIQRCRHRRATIVGTPGNDVLRGTPGPDVIAALGGNDRVIAAGGNDVVCGGSGADRLYGQGGRDTLLGGPGRDLLNGGAGRDALRGGPGRDRLVNG